MTKIGLINDRDAASFSDIQQHLDDYLRASRFEGHCDDFVKIKGSQLRRLIEGTAASRLTDLTPDRVTTYLQSLKKQKRSNRTVNQFRSSVVARLNWCVKKWPARSPHAQPHPASQ